MPNGHNNYLKYSQTKMAGGQDSEDMQFFEEQLFDAKQAMFAATTVREIKFLQSKIGYLQSQMTEMQKKERAKNKPNKSKKQKHVRGKKPKFMKYQPRAML